MSLMLDTMQEFAELLTIYETAKRVAERGHRGPAVEAAVYLALEVEDALVELHKECVAEDPRNSKDVVIRSRALLLDEKEGCS